MTTRSILLLLLVAPAAWAAPPTLTHLFPAGGARGTTVEVAATGSFETWPVGAWVEGKGVTVTPGKQKGKLQVAIAADAEPGPRWLRLLDAQGASSLRRFLVGTLPELFEQEPNDDYRKPQTLRGPGATVNGRLDRTGDVDCFAVKLDKGQTLIASLEANATIRSPMDGVLQVVSDGGHVLAQNNDHRGLDPQVVFRANDDGTYVVRLFAFPAVPDASVRLASGDNFIYRLTLTTAGFAERAFPLAVERGKASTVELGGWNIPELKRLVKVATGDEPESTVFAEGVAGTGTVRIETHACAVHARTGDKDLPQTLSLPVTVSGRVERSGEVHVYDFDARKGQRLSFQIESAALGFALDATLRVTDSAGKVLDRVQSRALGRDPELALTVPADGRYRLELRDLYGDGGPRHLYRLRAVLAESDFGLTVANDRFAVPPGKSLDIPVTIRRSSGFTAEVELVALALPAGVKAEAVKGQSPVLRLTADAKGALSGPLRIIGRAVGKSSHAHAALAEYGTTVPHLWLSVGGTAPPPEKPRRRRN